MPEISWSLHYWQLAPREHSFFRRGGGGPEEFRGASLIFCLSKKGGSAKILHNKEVGHYKFYCFLGEGHIF